MFHTLYNIGWGLKRPHCIFENYTGFCNKNLYTDKISCFLSNCEINYFQKISYELFHNHKLTLLINRLTRKSTNTLIVSVVLAVNTKQCAVCTRLRTASRVYGVNRLRNSSGPRPWLVQPVDSCYYVM